MKTKVKSALLFLFFLLAQCRFVEINQPRSAQPGETIAISVTVFDNIVPEPNPHKGVLAILIPEDWSFISAEYKGDLGTGTMELAPTWADSVEAHYPAAAFGLNMKWIGLTSDTGYTYQNPITVTADVRLQVGQNEGHFKLAYLITKATGGLIGNDPSWAPLSYPHPIGVPDSGQVVLPFGVERAADWDALLDRTSGWTGADGIYSIPLSGVETHADPSNERTLLVFSDTFIGKVDANNQRKDTKMVNNTYAVLHGNQPDPQRIQFFWRTNSSGQPQSVFVPETPNAQPGDWYWLMDGVAIQDKIYVFALRLNSGSGGGIFNFKIVGVNLLEFTLDASDSVRDCQQLDTPLFCKNEAEGWEIVLGQAVMPMTEAAGNPNPDGYLYVYGPRSSSSKKDLVAARVLPDEIDDFSRWQYWDGSAWGSEIANCAPITNGISQEFSVSPLDNGKFILVFQFGDQVGFRIGDSPIGPFHFYREIWNCPEVLEDPYILVYNAKAHPHLSQPGKLLISYNVNTFNFWDHFSNADIYRPRFITLELNEQVTRVEKKSELPTLFALSQNYPNPFNATTRIEFQLDRSSHVVLKIYNVLGQEMRTLIHENLNAGIHSAVWDGKNELGEDVGSGIYFYRIQIDRDGESKKMLLLQ
ncbi:MAG: DUF4185 domain-containing protein [candidate division KSB1 bacterium]|nr:DUF4185 domain-containing protein [candidate division KSB1 bacterium]